MERCLLTLEQWSPAFMAQEPVSWKTVFPRTRSREDGLGMIQADYIYCALCFESNAAANLTGGIDLWPRDWGHLLESIRGQVNSLSNCLQSAWRMGEGAGVLPTRPPRHCRCTSYAPDCSGRHSISAHGVVSAGHVDANFILTPRASRQYHLEWRIHSQSKYTAHSLRYWCHCFTPGMLI